MPVINPWLGLAYQAARLGFESQSVIALRLMRMAGGGQPAMVEGRAMIVEKLWAIGEANLAAARGMLANDDAAHTAHKVLAIYKKRVRANNRRLKRA
jgi:hypothetical protein